MSSDNLAHSTPHLTRFVCHVSALFHSLAQERKSSHFNSTACALFAQDAGVARVFLSKSRSSFRRFTLSPVKSILTKTRFRKLFRMNTYEKTGGECEPQLNPPPPSPSCASLPSFVCPGSPLFPMVPVLPSVHGAALRSPRPVSFSSAYPSPSHSPFTSEP